MAIDFKPFALSLSKGEWSGGESVYASTRSARTDELFNYGPKK
jgi:hypothetical protein